MVEDLKKEFLTEETKGTKNNPPPFATFVIFCKTAPPSFFGDDLQIRWLAEIHDWLAAVLGNMAGHLEGFAFHFLQPGKRGRFRLSHHHGEILVRARFAEVQVNGFIRFKYLRDFSGNDHLVGMVGVGLRLLRRKSFRLLLRPGGDADAEDERWHRKHADQVRSDTNIHADWSAKQV